MLNFGHLQQKSFKPYKGVSSNICHVSILSFIKCFKPYKGVSSNMQNAEHIYIDKRFKPYKGVSSNLVNNAVSLVLSEFQTL